MYTSISAQLSGQLRHAHSRLADFAEEVAFMDGEETEKLLVDREFAGVMMHEEKVNRRRWWFGVVEEGIIKWLWGSFGVSWLAHASLQTRTDTDEGLYSLYCVRYPCL